MVEVAYYDKGEAGLEKVPKTFQNFTYDNQTDGGILNLLNEVNTKIGQIEGDIQNLQNNYSTLIAKYEKFSNYDQTMKRITQTMTNNIAAIKKSYNNVVKTATQAINEHMSTDSSLMGDLDQLNRLLASGSKNI